MIDAEDRITYVSDNWWFFAEENGAGADCYPPQLLGRSLWDFIAGEETRHLYGILIGKTRGGKKGLQVPIRCDSPDRRRKIIIGLKSVGDGHIEFLCRTIRVDAREPVDLLRSDVARTDRIIRICSFCKQIATTTGEWIDTEQAIVRMALFIDNSLPKLSHSVCPACHAAALDNFRVGAAVGNSSLIGVKVQSGLLSGRRRMTNQHEQRKSKRVTALKPTFIYLRGNSFRVHDISNGGIGIVLTDDGPSFAVGELLTEIPIPLASGTVNLRGVVSHVSYTAAGKLCGIQFLFEGAEYEAVIRFINESLLNPADEEA